MNNSKANRTSHNVKISDNSFDPEELLINSGDMVVWTNFDNEDHTVTFTEGEFDSKNLKNQESYNVVFDRSGTYDYYCQGHPNMEGQIIVE